MITTILVILFSIFTTINANITSCENGLNCQCSLTTLDDLIVNYDDNKGMQITVDVSAWNGLKVVCNGTIKLDEFKYTSKPPGKSINSLSIRSCVLSDKTSLEKFVNKLGIKDLRTFSFQSFKANNSLLTEEHFNGISNLKELVLSHNSLLNISRTFFNDFPLLEKLDLSHNNLTIYNDIFDAISKLKYLDLSDNINYSLSPTLFYRLENLEYLDLENNPIGYMDESTFDKLVSLKRLNLRSIEMNKFSLEYFRKLKKLENIDMSYNSFVNISHIVFKENENLKQIFFHNIKIDSFTLPEYLFSNLQKLEEIYLNDDGFLTLPNNLFRNSTSLKYINLGNNSINQLYDTFFEGLNNLEVLKINNNSIKVIPKGIFKDLQKLKLLDLSMNYIESIPKGILEGLTSLTELNMENNLLKYIESETFSPLKKLSIAKFSNNQLDFANKTYDCSIFCNNHFLEELHLSNNSVQTFFNDWSENNNLKFLNLSHNNITRLLTKTFYFPSNNTLVDLRYNNISNIWLFGIEIPYTYENKKRDVKILIENNPILCDCNLEDLISYFHKELPIPLHNYIEIVAENLRCIHTNGTMGPKIKKIDSATYMCLEEKYFTAETNCPIRCKCYIRVRDKTRILDCSRKHMFDFVIDKEKPYLSYNYRVIIDLSYNLLTKIPSMKPLEPINVIGLKLSNNRISEITIDELPPTLKVLELHNNRIARIDYSVLQFFGPGNLDRLTLSANPIKCDCDVEALLHFVKLYRSTFIDLDSVRCEKSTIPIYTVKLSDICWI